MSSSCSRRIRHWRTTHSRAVSLRRRWWPPTHRSSAYPHRRRASADWRYSSAGPPCLRRRSVAQPISCSPATLRGWVTGRRAGAHPCSTSPDAEVFLPLQRLGRFLDNRTRHAELARVRHSRRPAGTPMNSRVRNWRSRRRSRLSQRQSAAGPRRPRRSWAPAWTCSRDFHAHTGDPARHTVPKLRWRRRFSASMRTVYVPPQQRGMWLDDGRWLPAVRRRTVVPRVARAGIVLEQCMFGHDRTAQPQYSAAIALRHAEGGGVEPERIQPLTTTGWRRVAVDNGRVALRIEGP